MFLDKIVLLLTLLMPYNLFVALFMAPLTINIKDNVKKEGLFIDNFMSSQVFRLYCKSYLIEF